MARTIAINLLADDNMGRAFRNAAGDVDKLKDVFSNTGFTANALSKELGYLDRQERANARATAIVEDTFKRLARAQQEAKDATDRLERGEIDAAKAAEIQEKAEKQLNRVLAAQAVVADKAAKEADDLADNHRQAARAADDHRGSLSKLFTGVSKQGSSAFSGLADAASGSASVVTKNWALALGAITAGLVALPAAAVVASSAVVGALGGGIASIGIVAAAQNKNVQKSFTGLVSHVKKVATEISKPFVPALIKISKFAQRTFDSFAPNLRDAFKTMAPTITDFADKLFRSFEQFKPAIAPLTDAFNTLLNALGPQLPGIFASISDAIIILSNVVQQNPNLLGELLGNLAATLPMIADFVGKLASVYNWTQRNKEGITKVTNVINLLANPVVIATKLVDLLSGAASKLSSMFQTAKDKVSGAANTVKTNVASAFNSAKSSVSNAMANILNAVKTKVSSVVSTIKGLPGKIKGALRGSGSLLYGIGKSIIQGLINGMQAMLGRLIDLAASIAGKIKAVKGPIEKDRVLLTPEGKAIMDGLMAGIATRIPDLAAQLKGVTNTIAGQPFTAPVGPSAASVATSPIVRAQTGAVAQTGSPTGTNTNITIRFESDGSDIGNFLLSLVRKEVRVRGGNVQTVLGR